MSDQFPTPGSGSPGSPDTAYGDRGSTRRRRSVSVTHLVFGVVFLGVAVAWWLHEDGVIEADGFRWVFPLVLILAGGAGLVASVMRSVQRERASRD